MVIITLITGPMFSGKTSRLLSLYNKFNRVSTENIVIGHIFDDRYSQENVLMTHNNLQIKCIKTNSLISITNLLLNKRYLFIDEAQFFDDLSEFLENIRDNTHILQIFLSGLNFDYNMKPFENIEKSIKYIDKVEHLKSRCSLCNEHTQYTFLKHHEQCISNSNVLVGSNDIYTNLCLECINM